MGNSEFFKIPEVGIFTSIAIFVGIILWSFQIIGNKIIDFREKKFDNANLLNYYIDVSKCFNKAIDDLKYLSKVIILKMIMKIWK